MDLFGARLLGFQSDLHGREIKLTIHEMRGEHYELSLHGVELFNVREIRQQNVLESYCHWKAGDSGDELLAAAFKLVAGGSEKVDQSGYENYAFELVGRVTGGKLEVLQLNSLLGAQMTVSFGAMSLLPVRSRYRSVRPARTPSTPAISR